MPAGVDAELAEAVAAELRAYLESGSAPPSVYCTGDWDEQRQRRHRDTVVLIKP
jgi:hypothetical protein